MNPNELGAEKLRAITDEMHTLGTDADGNDHFCEMIHNIVWVENDQGDIGGVQCVPTLGTYVDHVDDVCGWKEVNYSDKSLDEELAEIVETATQQMETSA